MGFSHETVSFGRVNIVEWQPITALPLVEALPWIISTVVGFTAIVRSPRMPLTHIATFALMTFAAFRVVRLAPFFALQWWHFLARRIQACFKGICAGAGHRSSDCGDRAPDRTGGFSDRLDGLSQRFVCTDGGILARQSGGRGADSTGGAVRTHADVVRLGRVCDLVPQPVDSRVYRRPPGDRLQRRRPAATRRNLWGPTDGSHLSGFNPDYIWLPNHIPTIPAMEALGWRRIIATNRSVVLSQKEFAVPPGEGVAAPCFPGGLIDVEFQSAESARRDGNGSRNGVAPTMGRLKKP